MLFSSFEFVAIFLPIVYLVYLLLNRMERPTPLIIWLTLSSCCFYAYERLDHLAIIAGSIAFNFALARAIQATRSKCLVACGVTANLLLLAYFKYWNFAWAVVATFGARLPAVETVVAPLAISFFTFQQISYLVDSLGRESKISLFDYSFTVLYFPHLIAGPIVLYREILPQLTAIVQKKRMLFVNFSLGLSIFCLGLVKKLGIADSVRPFVERAFTPEGQGEFIYAWMGVIGYTMQIYFDFSGYSDMAIGLSRIFGIKLPINFFSPYKSCSIIDFWRRWHISLSSFLREYLYLPLGGNRCSRSRMYLNLFLVMFIGGIWHGAAWNFMIWGALHGLLLVGNHMYRSADVKFVPRPLGWGLTLLSVMIGWVFFRAPSLTMAWQILRSMAGLNGLHLPLAARRLSVEFGGIGRDLLFTDMSIMFRRAEVINCSVLLVALAIALGSPNIYEFLRRTRPALNVERFYRTASKRRLLWTYYVAGTVAAAVAVGLLLVQHEAVSFLYFQF